MASLHRGLSIHPAGPSPSAVPSIDNDHDSISTPVTPDHRFRTRPLRNNSAKVSLQDHAPPAPPNHAFAHPCLPSDSTNCQKPRPTTPSPEPLESSPGPSSPSGLANIRIRRHHGSLLLQSPARAGHAARMRQIFEHASREQQTPQPNKPLLYPQLPNVSRKASPPPLAQSGHVRNQCQQTSPTRLPQSFCMSTASSRPGFRHAQAPFTVSVQSSESWSDDSDYLIMGSRMSKLTPAFVPDDRISKWLAGVSTPDFELHDAPGRPKPSQYVSSDFSDNASSRLAQQPLESRPAKVMTQKVSSGKDDTYTRTNFVPFKSPSPLKDFSPDHRSTKSPTRPTAPFLSYHNDNNHQLLSSIKDGIQLDPFSPNACIEHSLSHYHASRNIPSSNHESPTKIQCMSSKENIAPHNSVHAKHNAQGTLVPDAPCKVGVGTRFQHPRHLPHNRLGRGI